MMPALGVAMLLNYLGKKKLIPWFFGGFFLSEYSGLDLMAISIFAAIIALILYLNGSNKEAAAATSTKKVRRLSVDKHDIYAIIHYIPLIFCIFAQIRIITIYEFRT